MKRKINEIILQYFLFPFWKVILFPVVFSLICSLLPVIVDRVFSFELLGGVFLVSSFCFLGLRYFIEIARLPLYIIGDIKKNKDFEEKVFRIIKIVFWYYTVGLHVIFIIYLLIKH